MSVSIDLGFKGGETTADTRVSRIFTVAFTRGLKEIILLVEVIEESLDYRTVFVLIVLDLKESDASTHS